MIDIPKQNLIEMFRTVASEHHDQPATFFKGKFKTYADIETEVNKLANGLRKLGVKKGDRVAVYLPNSPQFFVTFFAVQSLGAIFTAFNPLYTAREIKQRLNDAQPKIFVTLDMFLDKVKKIKDEISVEHIIVTSVARELPSLKKHLYTLVTARKKQTLSGSLNYTDVLESGENKPIDTKIDNEQDIAVLQYTGGTTGLSKGAMLTHKNLIAQTVVLQYWKNKLEKQPEGQIKIAGVLPYAHIFGLTSSFLWPVSEGASIYLVPDPRKLEEVMKLIDKYRIHFLYCVPVFFQKFGSHKNISKYDLSSIHLSISGGESLPKQTVDLYEEKTGSLLIEGYGLTEASPVTHVNPPTKKHRKIGSIGVTVPNTKAKIVNPETNREINTPGVPGELWVKGPGVMKGYWQHEEETNDALKDGWLRTGDIASQSPEGYFKILDRLKDMIIVSGFKVWPNEVEDILLTHPAILEAAVIGQKTKLGTKLKAVIVRRPEQKKLSLDEIRSFCKQELAAYKVPKFVEYRDELPRSSVGKLLRRKLRGDAT
ncbi:MAG: AMP-binding protein [Candidatus Thermoplasmatota archaeon]|nr:AMP-binding protein [Candidatus Thermoplasmatota archaeon]